MKYSPKSYSPEILHSHDLLQKLWTIETCVNQFICTRGNEKRSIDYFDILDIGIEYGEFFGKLVLKTRTGPMILPGFTKNFIEEFQPALEDLIKSDIVNRLARKKIRSRDFDRVLREILDADRYLSQRDIQRWLASVTEISDELAHPYFDQEKLPASLRQIIQKVIDVIQKDSPIIIEHNKKFVDCSMAQCIPLFNQLEKYPLTEEQMRAAIIDEDRNLLIAAAGSGKSSTIIAKVAYLLHRQLATPQEILVLAYNKDAQISLDQRLQKLVDVVPGSNVTVNAKTFHGLGVEIIAHVEKKKPSVSELATASRFRVLGLFNEILDHLKNEDKTFAKKWREFLLLAKHSPPNPFNYDSKIAYENALKAMGASYRTSPDGGGRIVVPTMDGKEVKSFEEANLCNWLMMNGVEYEYERPYEKETATIDYRQYIPDFYYPQVNAYHEHFALDTQGQAPPIFANYLEGVSWKRTLHRKEKTDLFETHSCDFRDGSVYLKLEKALVKRGVVLSPLSEEEIDKVIKESFDVEMELQLFIAVLRHFKANNAEMSWLREKAKEETNIFRTNLFIDLFEKIHAEYQHRLGDDIDFEDQVNKACGYLESNSYKHPYKYVLVDETQDLSQDRKRMLHALINQRDETKLFAVGDDWQSIYRFSGADIDIMTKFPEHFGHTSQNFLTHTFRSYQGIVDVAAAFIQKNPDQLMKTVRAHESKPGDQVFIIGYDSARDMIHRLENYLERINKVAIERKMQLSVFLLGRYHRMCPSEIGSYTQRFPQLDVSFKSIHASKGLEADYVFLLGVSDNRYSFPSRITDDPLLRLVIPRSEAFPHAEERRLMYVALTRAKRAVYLFSEKNYVSPFITSLTEAPGVKADPSLCRTNPCPICDTGELRQKKGRDGIFWGCTKYPVCDYTIDATCPKCFLGKMESHSSGTGEVFRCSNYPECKHNEKGQLRPPENQQEPSWKRYRRWLRNG